MKKSKKIILFVFISILISSCSVNKSIWPDHFEDDGNNYFLMAQIESIKNDTIKFYTIEIYSTQPFFELKKFEEDSIKKTLTVLSLLNREEYQIGILKGANKNLMKKSILLYTKFDLWKKKDYVKYVILPPNKKLPLWEFYRMGTTKDENARYPRHPTTLQYKTVEKIKKR